MADVFGRGGVFGRGSGVRPQRSMAMGIGGASFVDREDPLLDPLSKKFQAGEDMTDAEIAALQAALGSKQYGLFTGKKEREADAALRGQILAESDRLAERSLERQAGIQDRITGKREADKMREAISGQAPIMSEADIAIFKGQLAGMSPEMLRQIENSLKQQAGEQQIVAKLIMDAAAAGVAPGSALNTPEERGALLGDIKAAERAASLIQAEKSAAAQAKPWAEQQALVAEAKDVSRRQDQEAIADALAAAEQQLASGDEAAIQDQMVGPRTPGAAAAFQEMVNKIKEQKLMGSIRQGLKPPADPKQATLRHKIQVGVDEYGDPVYETLYGTIDQINDSRARLGLKPISVPTEPGQDTATQTPPPGSKSTEYKRFRVYY